MLQSLVFCMSTRVSVRTCQIVARNFCQKISPDYSMVKTYQKAFKVQPGFGRLKLSSACSCIIKPFSPEESPNADHAQVILWQIKKSQEHHIDSYYQKDSDNLLRVQVSKVDENALCEIRLPLKYDVDADIENSSNLSIHNLEPENVNVSLKSGNLTTENIKCANIVVLLVNGCISFNKVLQGNIFISAKDMILTAGRLQGHEMHIDANHLKTDVESSYVEKNVICSNTGNITLKNLHGATSLKLLEGNISISNLHGSLDASIQKGDADVHISQLLQDSKLQIEEGSASISLIDSKRQNIELKASSITTSSDMEKYKSSHKNGCHETLLVDNGKNVNAIKAMVNNGNSHVSRKDWFSSLGIS